MTGALVLPQIATSQTQKEQTSNDADAALESAICNSTNIDLTSANYTVPNVSVNPGATDFKRNFQFIAQNATTVGRTVTLPAVARVVLLTADASCTQNVTFVCGSTPLVVAPGTNMLVRLDGTTNGLFQLAFNSGPPNVGLSYQGKPGSGATLLQYVYVQNGSFPIHFTGSQAKSDVAATSDSTFNVQKNGSTVATILFPAGQAVGTFTAASAVSFVSGDVLKVIAPNPQDGTLANIAITLKGG